VPVRAPPAVLDPPAAAGLELYPRVHTCRPDRSAARSSIPENFNSLRCKLAASQIGTGDDTTATVADDRDGLSCPLHAPTVRVAGGTAVQAGSAHYSGRARLLGLFFRPRTCRPLAIAVPVCAGAAASLPLLRGCLIAEAKF